MAAACRGACPSQSQVEEPAMDIHRLALYVTLGLGAAVLALNACCVVNGSAWLFSR